MNQLVGLPLAEGDTLHGLAGTGGVITYSIFGASLVKAGLLAQGELATGDAIILGPTPGGITISALILANTSGTPVTGVALSISGAASVAAGQIISNLTIPASGQAILAGDGQLRVYDVTGQLFQTSGTVTFDATIPAITTPLALGTAGTAVTAPHRDHTHQSPGGVAAIAVPSAAIVDTQTQVVGATIPGGLLRAGTVLRVRAFGFITSTVDNLITFRFRLGPTTLTGNIPASLAVGCGNSGTVTAAGFDLDLLITVRTAGAGGTVYGIGHILSLSSGAAVTQALALANELFVPASVAVDTTVANVAELTCITAAGTTAVTFQAASIEISRM